MRKTLAKDGFDEWLRYLKKKWRLAKLNSVTRRNERGMTVAVQSSSKLCGYHVFL